MSESRPRGRASALFMARAAAIAPDAVSPAPHRLCVDRPVQPNAFRTPSLKRRCPNRRKPLIGTAILRILKLFGWARRHHPRIVTGYPNPCLLYLYRPHGFQANCFHCSSCMRRFASTASRRIATDAHQGPAHPRGRRPPGKLASHKTQFLAEIGTAGRHHEPELVAYGEIYFPPDPTACTNARPRRGRASRARSTTGKQAQTRLRSARGYAHRISAQVWERIGPAWATGLATAR